MKKEHIYLLIKKHLSGKATKKEVVDLSLWINESDKNRDFAKTYLKIEKFDRALNFNPQNKIAWKHIKDKIDVSSSLSTHKQLAIRLYKYAAIILFIFGMSFLIVNRSMLVDDKMILALSTDSIVELLLPDGSSVFLNKNSELEYPKKFPKKQRKVFLKGEAFFKVSPNKEKPFIIESSRTRTKVLGTSFNLRAYSKEAKESISVLTGKVSFSGLTDSSQIKLIANQEGIFEEETSILSKNNKIDINILSWKDNNFRFDNSSLEYIVETLNRAFSCKIIIQNKALAKEHISTSFTDSKLDDILIILSKTLDFEYKYTKDNLIIIR